MDSRALEIRGCEEGGESEDRWSVMLVCYGISRGNHFWYLRVDKACL